MIPVVSVGTCQSPANAPPSPPRCTWLQMSVICFCTQVGWGLWLLPTAFARLGWLTCAACLLTVAALMGYIELLFGRLFQMTGGVAVYADVAQRAAGQWARHLVVSVTALQAILVLGVIQLAAAISLQQLVALGGPVLPLWGCGLIVAAAVWLLMQLRLLATAAKVMYAATLTQVIAALLFIAECIRSAAADDSSSSGSLSQASQQEHDLVAPFNLAENLTGLMTLLWSYGGQLVFFDLLAAMQHSSDWPKAQALKHGLMLTLYGAVGSIGYWRLGRAAANSNIALFLAGSGPLVWATGTAMLFAGLCSNGINAIPMLNNLLRIVLACFRHHRLQHTAGRSCNSTGSIHINVVEVKVVLPPRTSPGDATSGTRRSMAGTNPTLYGSSSGRAAVPGMCSKNPAAAAADDADDDGGGGSVSSARAEGRLIGVRDQSFRQQATSQAPCSTGDPSTFLSATSITSSTECFSPLLWAASSCVLLVVAYALGMAIPHFTAYVGICTSVFYILTSAVFPVSFYMLVGYRKGVVASWGLVRCSVLLFVWGALMVSGLYAALQLLLLI